MRPARSHTPQRIQSARSDIRSLAVASLGNDSGSTQRAVQAIGGGSISAVAGIDGGPLIVEQPDKIRHQLASSKVVRQAVDFTLCPF